MLWKSIAANRKVRITLAIAVIFVLVGLISFFQAVRSDAYLEAERFITSSKQVQERVGEVIDYSLDSFGVRLSNGLRVYYRYSLIGEIGNASITVWLVKNKERNVWQVIHHRISMNPE